MPVPAKFTLSFSVNACPSSGLVISATGGLFAGSVVLSSQPESMIEKARNTRVLASRILMIFPSVLSFAVGWGGKRRH
jgi:hypothetical protein